MTKFLFDKAEAKSRMVRKLSDEQFDEYGSEVIARLDAICDWAEQNYEKGNWLVETHTVEDICKSFVSLADAKRYCKLMCDREQDVRGS